MIKKTIWKPDTCKCEIEYEWDDTIPQDERVHSVSNIIKCCDEHILMQGDKNACYDCVLDENQRKNRLLGIILENIPTAVNLLPNGQGKELKPDREYKWSFDMSRNLVVELIGFSEEEKSSIQLLKDSISPDKIIIQ